MSYFNSGVYTTKDAHDDVVGIHKIEDIKITNPVEPSKIVCIGLNYKDHTEKLNMNLPDTPKLFIKPFTSVIGDNDYNRISY